MKILKEKIRDLKRFKEILSILIKNEFGFLVKEAGLHLHLPFKTRIKKDNFEFKSITPKKAASLLENLGGAFIKLGQLLSLRPDLIPTEYCEEFKKLQDKVRPFAHSRAREMISKELEVHITEQFEVVLRKPLASASIGQVYYGKLKNGQKVAIKIQRPEAKETFYSDIDIMSFLAKKIQEKFGTQILNPVEIVDEFKRYTYHELDYNYEGKNIEIFYKNFKDSKDVKIPKPYPGLTTEKLLVMEYIDGVNITLADIKNSERKKLADKVANMVFKQVFLDGFFHADPHPGNVFLTKQKKIALLDFGIIGHIDRSLKERMSELFANMINGNLHGLAQSLKKMNMIDSEINIEMLKEDLYDTIGQYYNTSLKKINFSNVFHKTIDVARKDNIKLPSNLVLLGKSILTMEGICREIYPDFDLVDTAKPFIKKYLTYKFDPKRLAKEITETSKEFKTFIRDIPETTENAIAQAKKMHYDMKSLDSDVKAATSEVSKSSNRVVYALIITGLLISSSLALNFGNSKILGISSISFLGFSICILILMKLLFDIMNEKN